MLGTLGHLKDRCDLRVRSRKQARDLLGQGLVGSEAGQLVLPQIEIALGQPIDVGRIMVVGSHCHTIPQPPDGNVSQAQMSLAHELSGLGSTRVVRF